MRKHFLIIVLTLSLLMPAAAFAHHGGFFGFHFFESLIKAPLTLLKSTAWTAVRGYREVKSQMAAAVFIAQENIEILGPSDVFSNEFVVVNQVPNESLTPSETLPEPIASEPAPVAKVAIPEQTAVKETAVKPIAKKSSAVSVSAPAELSSAQAAPVRQLAEVSVPQVIPVAPQQEPASQSPPAPAELSPAPAAEPKAEPAPHSEIPSPQAGSIPTPIILSALPSSMRQGAVGQNFTVNGNNMIDGVAVLLSGNLIAINSASLNKDTGNLTANFSIDIDAAIGLRDVTVVNINAKQALCKGCFTVISQPVVSSLTPSALPQGATNQNIVIAGKNFFNGAVVDFTGNGITVNSATVNSQTQLTVNISISGSATASARNVKITNFDGGDVTCGSCFTVVPKPTISLVTPSCGTLGQTYTLAIAGLNFVSGATASFSGSGITVNSTVFNSAISLTTNLSIASAADVGSRNLTVTNTDGGTGTAAGAFTVTVEWGCPVLVGSYNTPSSAKAKGVFVVGTTAYLLTDGSGDDLHIINIANPAAPVLLGSLELDAGANGVYVSGNYAYIASKKDNEELQIIDISNPASPSKIGTYDKQGDKDALGIAFANSKIYLATDNEGGSPGYELYIIDVASPSAPALLGGLDIGKKVYGVSVSGTYAYLATEDDSKELQIINVSDPAAPSVAGTLNLSGGEDAYSVFVSGNYAYLGRKKAGGGNGEFYVIDVSNASSPSLSGQLEINEDVNGVYVSGTKAFLATKASSAEFQVIDVSTPSSPVLLGSYNLSDDANAVFVSDNVAFVATDNGSQELVILKPY